MSNLPSAMVPAAPIAYFKLKSSESYRFWRNRRLIDLKKGTIHSVSDREDAEYFRARPDVVVECDVQGNVFGASAPGAIDPKKAKTFRTYRDPAPGSAASKGPPPPPPVVTVGKAQPEQRTAPVVAIPPPPPGSVARPAPSNPVNAGQPPALPPPPPLDRKARGDKAKSIAKQIEEQSKSEPMSPIEEVDSSGKTAANIAAKR